MRKLLFLLLLFITLPACAQRIDKPGEPYEYFIQVDFIGEISGKFKAKINFYDGAGSQYIVDENKKKIEFNNRGDIINYFTKRGWVFVDFYDVSRYYEIVFKKEVKDDSEIKQNIRTSKEK